MNTNFFGIFIFFIFAANSLLAMESVDTFDLEKEYERSRAICLAFDIPSAPPALPYSPEIVQFLADRAREHEEQMRAARKARELALREAQLRKKQEGQRQLDEYYRWENASDEPPHMILVTDNKNCPALVYYTKHNH